MGIAEDVFAAAFHGVNYPPPPEWIRWRHIPTGLTHCQKCLKLDDCWFADNVKPALPQHDYCHCIKIPLSYDNVLDQAEATCDIRKFTEYLFSPKYNFNGKGKKFIEWGYSIEDSQMLKEEYEKQALEKYTQSDYTLGALDKEGQRINIRVELFDRNKNKIVIVKSGWMVDPDGKIRLATPFCGR